MDNIIDSFRIELSQEAKNQQSKAIAGLDDTRLIEHFAPLKWDNIDGNQGTDKFVSISQA